MAEKLRLEPAVRRTIWTVLVGGLAVLFDTTIVAVALNSMATDLDVSVATIQWVSTGYLLALGASITLTGWAQRAFGARRLWIGALTLFLIGSVLSSLAWSAGSLIAFRVVQGIGGGVLMPLMATIVMQAAAGKNIGRVMSVVGLPAVLGPILGPVIGGLILQKLDWSWLFWVNVPFCVVGVVLAARFLPVDKPVERPRLDVVGFFLLAPALVAILWGLSKASGDDGFASTGVLTPVVFGLVFLASFVLWALTCRGKALLDLRLLRYRPLSTSAAVQFFAGLTLYGALLLVPLYFQQVRGLTALQTGLILIPQGVGTLAIRQYIARLSDTVGPRWLVAAGFALVLVGTVPFTGAGAHSNTIILMVGLFVRGVGLGTVTVPLMTAGFRGLSRSEIPDASVISRVSQQVGGSFGTAVLAVIVAAGHSGASAMSSVERAFHEGFWWSLGFTAAGVLLALLLPAQVSQSRGPGPALSPDGSGSNGGRGPVPGQQDALEGSVKGRQPTQGDAANHERDAAELAGQAKTVTTPLGGPPTV